MGTADDAGAPKDSVSAPKSDARKVKKPKVDRDEAKDAPPQYIRAPKLDDNTIAKMRKDFNAGKSVEEVAQAFGIKVDRARRWFNRFTNEDRVAKAIPKVPETQTTPSATQIVSISAAPKALQTQPNATTEQNNVVGQIYSDFWAGLTIPQVVTKHGITEPMAQEVLGWTSKTPLDQGIRSYVDQVGL